METERIEVVVKSDKGVIKQINEDNFIIKVGQIDGKDFGLFALCDGLGGLEKGEVASKKMVSALEVWWHSRIGIFLGNNVEDKSLLIELRNVLIKVNKELFDYGKENNIRLGTTASILLILKGKFYICHIGDSRIYVINESVKKLTEDHTYYNQLLKEGNIEKSKTVKRSILTQCVGVGDNIKPNFFVGKLSKKATFVLCSDGFYNKMKDEDFIEMKNDLYEGSDYGYMGEVCASFIEKIKARGEKDNISVIAIKYSRNRGVNV
ncbi:serine/threonine-protein phosphatase [Clostridium bornimense]|uniref:PP2C family protein-serine/threonine phosphatase n=1 Tax=Clostridium bornimense TaxID=1216932 RepID=UPI001C114FCD|nr:serine/threonine-protein phosphatase [Clostridium bornimense]